jgi:hypothetical protein
MAVSVVERVWLWGIIGIVGFGISGVKGRFRPWRPGALFLLGVVGLQPDEGCILRSSRYFLAGRKRTGEWVNG